MAVPNNNRTSLFRTHRYYSSIFGLILSATIGFLIFQVDLILVLVALIGLGLLTWMFAKPETATIITLFALYANLAVVLKKSHGVPEFVAASFVLLLGLPIINQILVHRKGVVIDRIFLLIVAYFVALLLSASLSANIEDSVDRLLSHFLEGVILCFLVFNSVRSVPVLRKTIWALLFAGVFMGSISLYQEITGSYDNDFGGLAIAKESTIGTGKVDVGGDDVDRRRLAGPLGSKNRYAQVMVVLLPLALFRFWGESSRLMKFMATAACVPIMCGALLTFSRGAGLAIFLVLLIMTFLRYIKVRHFLLTLVVCIIVVLVAIPDYVYRAYKTYAGLTSVASGEIQEADASIRGRATVNLAAFKVFLDHPILGVGPGQTNVYIPDYASEDAFRRIGYSTRRAHNMYLEELADTGLLGFGLLMAIPIGILAKLRRMRRIFLHRRPELAHIATGFMLAIVTYLLTAMFLHLSYVRYFWLIIALAGAAVHILEMESQKEQMDDSADLKYADKYEEMQEHLNAQMT